MAEQPLSPEEGFTSILERYEKMVYGFALARTGSRADADDVFQEVFLAYFQCGKHFREGVPQGLAPCALLSISAAG